MGLVFAVLPREAFIFPMTEAESERKGREPK